MWRHACAGSCKAVRPSGPPDPGGCGSGAEGPCCGLPVCLASGVGAATGQDWRAVGSTACVRPVLGGRRSAGRAGGGQSCGERRGLGAWRWPRLNGAPPIETGSGMPGVSRRCQLSASESSQVLTLEWPCSHQRSPLSLRREAALAELFEADRGRISDGAQGAAGVLCAAWGACSGRPQDTLGGPVWLDLGTRRAPSTDWQAIVFIRREEAMARPMRPPPEPTSSPSMA